MVSYTTSTNGKAKKPRTRGKSKDAPIVDAPSSRMKKLSASEKKAEAAKTKEAKKFVAEATKIEIRELAYQWARICLVGDTPKLSGRMSDISRGKIRDNEAHIKRPKVARNPEEDFLQSLHICSGKREKKWLKKNLYGFPAVGIKKAMASAGYRSGMYKNKVDIMSFLFVNGPYAGLAPIFSERGNPKARTAKGKQHVAAIPTMQEDIVYPQAAKGATFAYRGCFYPWFMELEIRFWPELISIESVVNLLEIAGSTNGIGSWRIEKSGNNGAFHVDRNNIEIMPTDYQPPLYH